MLTATANSIVFMRKLVASKSIKYRLTHLETAGAAVEGSTVAVQTKD